MCSICELCVYIYIHIVYYSRIITVKGITALQRNPSNINNVLRALNFEVITHRKSPVWPLAATLLSSAGHCSGLRSFAPGLKCQDHPTYPLVNIQEAMENHHAING